MNKRSKTLRDLAIRFIHFLSDDLAYATIGGSVARGTADLYSDIDITLYTHNPSLTSANILFENEYIQIEVKSVEQLPDMQAVLEDPWENRYIREAAIIFDHDHRFIKEKRKIDLYFQRRECKEKMIRTVSALAEARLNKARDFARDGKNYSAMIAAKGAWAEAALLYQFVNYGLLSTNTVISTIERDFRDTDQLKKIFSYPSLLNMNELAGVMRLVRRELREKGKRFSFGLSTLQDDLTTRKSDRLLKAGDYFNLLWQTYGEALWLYFETAEGLSFEEYREELSEKGKKGMERLGFSPVKDNEIEELETMTRQLLNFAPLEKSDLS